MENFMKPVSNPINGPGKSTFDGLTIAVACCIILRSTTIVTYATTLAFIKTTKQLAKKKLQLAIPNTFSFRNQT